MEYSFPRYLNAKRTVDDRALNRLVLEALEGKAKKIQAKSRMRVLEIGMGTASMLQRLVEWGMFRNVDYVGIDSSVENVAAARKGIGEWANRWGLSMAEDQGIIQLAGLGCDLTVQLDGIDLFDFLGELKLEDGYDLLIANAFLDLIDASRVLPRLASQLKPGGLAYFSINFDGVSIFEPVIDAELDALILGLYHRSMDERRVAGHLSGSSQTGRRLFHWLAEAGYEILSAGPSDWIIYPSAHAYPADEAYFLHHILHFIEQTLSGHPQLNSGKLSEWIQTRRGQIDGGKLVFIAHQVDFLAKAPQPGD